MYVKCSMDMITILGRSSNNLEKWIGDPYNTWITERREAKFPYRWQFTMVDGTFLQVGESKPGFKSSIRLMFNPNHALHEVYETILKMINFERISRIDIAIDYFGLDLSKVQWHEPKHRKRNLHLGGNQQLETLYIGSRESKLMWRIYNKALEQKKVSEGIWWRVEAEIKPKDDGEFDINEFNPFGEITGTIGLEETAADWEERAKMKYLYDDPVRLAELNDRTRARYKKMILEQSIRLEPQPSDVWENEKEDVLAHIFEIKSICNLASLHIK